MCDLMLVLWGGMKELLGQSEGTNQFAAELEKRLKRVTVGPV